MSGVSRALRDKLDVLSLELFGTSSRWKKIMETSKIETGYEIDRKKTEENKKLLQARAHHNGTTFELEESLSDPTVRVKVWRSPTPEEVLNALSMIKDSREYAALSNEDIAIKAAKQFKEKSLSAPISLLVPVEEEEKFNTLLNDLPLNEREQLKRISSNVSNGSPFQINGVWFVTQLLS
jgi:hypothetical protein